MRNVREVLRLKHQVQLPGNQVALSLGMSRRTVQEYLARAEAVGLVWPLPEDMDDAALEARLFPVNVQNNDRPQPDFIWMHQELGENKHLTLRQLHKEYKREYPNGYQFSHYCELYHGWLKTVDVSMRQVHQPGDRMFIDFAGDKILVIDARTGEPMEGHLFVAVLGYSNFTYVEVFPDETAASWAAGICNALEYFKGVPRILTPDNAKGVIIKPCRYEPEVHTAIKGLATHYSMAVIPAYPKKPKHKAKVESGVGIAERQILAALRHRDFFSFGEVNAAVWELLKELNERPFEKLEGSRRMRFETVEKAKLRPLPASRYELEKWCKPKVHPDHHVQVDSWCYSVPYQLTGQQVEARLTASTVEILYKGRRVASHARLRGKGESSTLREHMPPEHQKYLEHNTLEWVLGQAKAIGPNVLRFVEAVAKRREVPEQTIRTSQGILGLAKRYTGDRVEVACAIALANDTLSYRKVKTILDNEMDRLPQEATTSSVGLPVHENLRGPAYYGGEN
ncbi:MAG: IS21 family transposase [Peptococcaceae bacterium]|jgi:transposase|nr:IS21 family transposase [Peptococcaceae bacterium]